MKVILDYYKKTGSLHHAYLIEGDKDLILPELMTLVEKILGEEPLGHPDLWLAHYNRLSIEEARSIRSRASTKALEGGKKFFILSLSTVNHEANHALLKTIEEAKPGTHFFLIVPAVDTVLPTIQSRCFVLSLSEDYSPKLSRAREFLESPPAERLKFIQPLLDRLEEAEDEEKREVKEEIRLFALNLEKHLFAQSRLDLSLLNSLRILKETDRYLTDPASSSRLILEHLALVLPQYDKI